MIRFVKKHAQVFLSIAVLFIVFLLHTSYLNNGFTWLDHGDIEEGRSIVALEDFTNVFYVPFGETGFYRPLVTLLTSTDHAVYNTFAPGYHLTNVLLHLLVVAAVPLFLSAFFVFTLPEMLLAMFIVGIHPLTWLPVGAISYRPELLLTLFTFLTVYFHVKARLTGKEWFKLLAVISFLLALFSKETALVIVPALIIFWEWLHKKKPAWGLYFSEFGIVFIYFMLRMQAVPGVWNASHAPLPLAQEVGTRLAAIQYLWRDFLNPTTPPLSDAVSVVSVLHPLAILTILMLGILIACFIKFGVNSPWGRAGILFLLLLTPALNIIPVPRIGSPHYGYLPLVIFAAVVVLIMRLAQKAPKPVRKGVYGLIGCWIVVMGVSVFLGGFHFKNDVTLFKPEVARSPEFLEGHLYLGTYYLKKDEYAAAEKELFLAMQTNANSQAYTEKATALINLSVIYMQQQDFEKAQSALFEAAPLSQSKNDQALYHNMMLLAYKKRDYKNVIALSENDRAFPYTPLVYFILADTYHQLNQDKDAMNALEGLMRIANPQQREIAKKMMESLILDLKLQKSDSK